MGTIDISDLQTYKLTHTHIHTTHIHVHTFVYTHTHTHMHAYIPGRCERDLTPPCIYS